LRGPQTPGELRTRTERMYEFEDLESVHNALNLLAKREPPLVRMLPRQPGTKESRYVHLLSPAAEGQPTTAGLQGHPAHAATSESGESSNDHIATMQSELDSLRSQVAELQRQFAEFRKQFD